MMTSDATKTLFHPFETDALPAPAAGASVLFLGAEPGFRLPDGFDASILAVQGFRPRFPQASARGPQGRAARRGRGFRHGAGACQPSSRRERAAHRRGAFARAAQAGSSWWPAAKDDGIASLLKRMSALVTIDGQLPKFHGVAFWLTRPADADAIVEALRVRQSRDLGRRPLPCRARHVFGRRHRSRLAIAGRPSAERHQGRGGRFLRGLGLSGQRAGRAIPGHHRRSISTRPTSRRWKRRRRNLAGVRGALLLARSRDGSGRGALRLRSS